MTTPTNKTIEEIVQKLGDICHQYYLGCTQTPDGYEYAYSNEVINLLSTPEATQAITQAMLDVLPEKKEAYDNITTLNGEDYIVESESYNQAIDQMESAIKLMGGE